MKLKDLFNESTPNILFILSSIRLQKHFFKYYFENTLYINNNELFNYSIIKDPLNLFNLSNQSNTKLHSNEALDRHSKSRDTKNIQNPKDTFLPKVMSEYEFLDYIVYFDKIILPKPLRRYFLSVAIERVKKDEDIDFLVFENSFIAFLETSNFLFDFFDEFSTNNMKINEDLFNLLALKDTYEDYCKHLNIILKIFKEYVEILEFNNFASPNDDFKIISEFVSRFSEIHVEVDGILSPKEISIFKEVSLHTKVFLHFKTTQFNSFITLPHAKNSNNFYCINTNTLVSTPLKTLDSKNIFLYECAQRVNQVNIALHLGSKWIDMIEAGESELDFGLILPDESFAKILEGFDSFNIFNLSMGREILDLEGFLEFEIIYKYFVENGDFDFKYLEYLESKRKKAQFIHKYMDTSNLDISSNTKINVAQSLDSNKNGTKDIESSNIHSIQPPYNIYSLEHILLLCFSEYQEILENTLKILFDLKNVANKFYAFNMEFKDIFKIIYDQVKSMKISDKVSGKIRVMGILETRGLSFKEVLIFDFNESKIAQMSGSDLFLNTNIRKALNLPTTQDKENLQKNHYLLLMQNTQKVHISYVQNESEIPSSMIYEIKIDKSPINIDEIYSYYDFNKAIKNNYKDEDFANFTYTRPISSSALDTYLRCERKFFFKYIEGLEEEKNDSLNIGTILHNSLNEAYLPYLNKTLNINDIAQIEKNFKNILSSQSNERDSDVCLLLKIHNYKHRLGHFFSNERDRVNRDEIKIIGLEKKFVTTFNSIKLYGIIDRLEICNDEINVIDYKSGQSFKIGFKNSIQLPFYSILLKDEFKGQSKNFFIYSLEEYRLVCHENISNVEENILQNIDNIGKSTKKTQDIKKCYECEYKILCNR